MLRALATTSCNYLELAAISSQSQSTISNWLTALRNAKLVHVCAWDGDTRGYPTVPRFAFGIDKPDAIRPSIPANVRAQKIRDRKKEARNG